MSESMGQDTVLYIIVPCYNEEEVLPITCSIFLDKIYDLIKEHIISDRSRILFVNDGSSDRTWEIIKNLSKQDEHYIGISQSRNRGHQNAVLAGLMEASGNCDITISIDCDGQDDINVMDEMIKQYLNGNEIVYAARSKRDADTIFKRFSAESFYRLLNWMGVEAVYNHADYRLLSNRVLSELSDYQEVNLFLRGLIPLIGFKSTVVYYERSQRIAGKSHYPLKKMLTLAFDGITSFSVKPLRIISWTGILMVFLSLVGISWVVCQYFLGKTVSGWSSVVCSVLCVGGGTIGQFGSDWRIYWENLFGNEASTSLYHK